MSKRRKTCASGDASRTHGPPLTEAQSPGKHPPPAARFSRFARLAALLGAMLLAGLGAVVLARRSLQPGSPVSLSAGNSTRGAASSSAAASLPGASPAEESLRADLARSPRDPAAHRALAGYLLDEGRPLEALWHVRAAHELAPADAASEIDAARSLTRAGFSDQARALLRARLAQAPSDLEARLVLAETALAVARPAEALAALTAAGAALDSSALAQLLLGDARYAAGDLPGARTAYQRAVSLEEGEGVSGREEGKDRAGVDGAAYDRLGRLALAEEAWAVAQAAFAAARDREPGVVGHGHRLALALWGAGQRQTAEWVWESLAATAPEYAPARLELGKACRQRKQWDAAAAHLVAAVQHDPASEEAQFALAEVMTEQGDRASAHYQRGFYYLKTDRPQQALQEFRRLVDAAPDRIDGPLMMSLASIQMERLDLAAEEAKRGLARHPNDGRLLARLAALYMLGRSRPLARQLCEEWRQKDPNAAEPYRLLSRIAREQQRLPESLAYGEQALARDPENAAVCLQMAKTLTALGGPENTRRALDLARRAAERDPREAEHWHQFGVLLRGAGRPREAAGALLRALDLDPTSVASATLLVQIAAQVKLPETSRFFARLVPALEERNRTGKSLWRPVYRNPADAAAHGRLARFLPATGDLLRAGYQLQQVVALRPDDQTARRDLAVIERLLALRVE